MVIDGWLLVDGYWWMVIGGWLLITESRSGAQLPLFLAFILSLLFSTNFGNSYSHTIFHPEMHFLDMHLMQIPSI